MEFNKAKAELAILNNFIDFINSQVGVYCDSLSGFSGNRVRVERQIQRGLHPTNRVIKNGQPVITWTSIEDPTFPDIIHTHVTKADEYIQKNSEADFNEQQICWSIIVFIFACWDEEIRPQIANIRGIQTNDLILDEFGDLRILRKHIVHNSGFLPITQYQKLKVMKEIVEPDKIITFTHDQMHKLFIFLKRGIGKLLLEYTGDLPNAPNADKITNSAIQRN